MKHLAVVPSVPAYLDTIYPTAAPTSSAEKIVRAVEFGIALDELGVDALYLRGRRFEQRLASLLPVLAAIAGQTTRITLGTSIIDIRYENPYHLAEDAATLDIITGGRLELGLGRGGGDPHIPQLWGAPVNSHGQTSAELAHSLAAQFVNLLGATGIPRPDGPDRVFDPVSPGLRERLWWSAASTPTAAWAAAHGMSIMVGGGPAHPAATRRDAPALQAEQIRTFHTAWRAAGWPHPPRVAIGRDIFPVTTPRDRNAWAPHLRNGIYQQSGSKVKNSIYAGHTDTIIELLATDKALHSADVIMLSVPNIFDVDRAIDLVKIILTDIAPALGWRPTTSDTTIS